jgi:hypothetical protein
MYSVCGTWPFTSRVRFLSLLNTKCNLLGYWRHRSVCYSCLFTIPLLITTVFLLQCVMTLWRCDVASRSGTLISSVIYSVISFGVSSISISSLFICLLSLSFLKVKVTLRLMVSLSVSRSWCRAPSDIYYGLTVMVSLLWGSLSDERPGLFFVYAAGPCQQAIGQVSFLSICRPSNRVFAPGIEDPFPHDCLFRCSGFPTIWLLRNS